MLLLAAAYVFDPSLVKGPVLVLGALMMVTIAFSSIELTLYLLILSTLLSPELTFGGHSEADLAAGKVNTTESRGITLRLDDMLLTLVCVTWMFRMALRQEVGIVRQTPINQPMMWYWVVTLFSTLIAMFSGKVGAYGLFFVIKYLEYFMLFFMIINHVQDENTIKRYLWVMLFTCIAASLAGIAQIPSGQRVSAPFEGELGEPNTFGGYLVLMISVSLGMFLYTAARTRRRYGLMLCMILMLIPLAFTESRSSYLSFIVAITAFLWISRRKRFLVVVTMIGVVLLPFVLPKNVINRVMFTFHQSQQSGQLKVGSLKIDTSTSERLHAWGSVMTKYFPQHPLLGVGVTGGPFLDAQYPRVLLETGMLGLLLFFWFLRRTWALLREAYRTIEDDVIKGAALGTLCGFAGLLVHAIGANTFIIIRIMEPLMILLALMMAALMLQRQRDEAAVVDARQGE